MNAEDMARKILRDNKIEEETRAELASKNVIAETSQRWFSLARFWYQFVSSFTSFWNRFVRPVYKWLYWFYGIIFWNNYRKLWDWYVRDKNGSFSRIRGGTLIAMTIASLFIVYQLLFVTFDTALYVTTARVNEVVYLSNAQEISADDNLHSAQGCVIDPNAEEFSCDASASLYFRIKPSLFNHLWSLTHEGSLFLPDYVAAPIAPGWQECTITSYGIRVKFFMRAWDLYPELLAAECREIPS